MAGLQVWFALSSGSCSGFVLSSGLQVTSLGLGSGSGVGVGFVLCCAVLCSARRAIGERPNPSPNPNLTLTLT